jgi:hypothetical protein
MGTSGSVAILQRGIIPGGDLGRFAFEGVGAAGGRM